MEGRFSFGVCMKKDEHGNGVGVHLPVFDYTAKKLVSINVENTMINTEIQRVIALPCDKRVAQKWCGLVQRTPGSIYEQDNLSVITGIGKKKQRKIEMIYNIDSVMELSILTDNEVVELAITCNLNKQAVYDWCEQCQAALPGKCPFLKNSITLKIRLIHMSVDTVLTTGEIKSER
jgi:hypothetical protein